MLFKVLIRTGSLNFIVTLVISIAAKIRGMVDPLSSDLSYVSVLFVLCLIAAILYSILEKMSSIMKHFQIPEKKDSPDEQHDGE